MCRRDGNESLGTESGTEESGRPMWWGVIMCCCTVGESAEVRRDAQSWKLGAQGVSRAVYAKLHPQPTSFTCFGYCFMVFPEGLMLVLDTLKSFAAPVLILTPLFLRVYRKTIEDWCHAYKILHVCSYILSKRSSYTSKSRQHP